jgi:hypothetical protein
VAALALPLSTALVGVTAAPAWAASRGTLTLDTTVATSGNPTATVSPAPTSCSLTSGCKADGTLKVVRADGVTANTWTIKNGSSATSYTINANGVKNTVANGTWTVTLSDYGGSTPKSFVTNFKPFTPDAVSTTDNGVSRVDLSWTYLSTPEPDFQGFRLSDGVNAPVDLGKSACSGSSCSYTWLYDNATPGSYSYTYSVTALRSSGGCDTCGDHTEATSASKSVTLVTPQPPPPSPTPTPSSGGGTTGSTTGTTGGTTGSTTGGSTGGTTGSTTGGTTGSHTTTTGGTTGSAAKPAAIPTLPPLVASRRNFALSFNHFSPSLGIPKLPPLPATKFPVTASGSEAYNPTLPYTAQPRKTTSVLSSPVAAFQDNVDPRKLAKALAFALILLAAAAHVRVFLSHTAED